MVRQTSILAGIASVALAAGLASPAAADTDTFKDKHGDLKGGFDIRSVRVDNDGPQIAVRSKHRNLRYGQRAPSGSVAAYIDIAPRRKGPEFILAGPVGFDGGYHITKMRRWKMVGKPLRCKSLKFHVNYKRDAVRFAVGRRCLDRAYDKKIGKIRVALRASQFRKNGNGMRHDWLGKPRHMSKWVQAN